MTWHQSVMQYAKTYIRKDTNKMMLYPVDLWSTLDEEHKQEYIALKEELYQHHKNNSDEWLIGQIDYYLHCCQEPLDYDWIGAEACTQILKERGYECYLGENGWKWVKKEKENRI